MKTFKQWFDNLSPETQKYLCKECKWVDLNHPDYYRKEEGSMSGLNTCLHDIVRGNEDILQTLVNCLGILKSIAPSELPQSLLTESLEALCASNRTLLYYRPLDKIRKYYKEYFSHNDKGVLKHKLTTLLLLTKNFDNIEWDSLYTDDLVLTPIMQEICGDAAIYMLAKKEPKLVTLMYGEYDNDLFDRLFFGEDGWTEEQKISVISDYSATLDGVNDFMGRIVAVDKYYLKYIPFLIGRDTVLGRNVYQMLKPECDLTGNESTEMKYRYSKDIRKLFQMAACCKRRNLGKAMAGTIGDASALLKLYNWDFATIFECLCPECAEPIIQTNEGE